MADRFAATGATWWYQSNGHGHQWVYLNTSTKRLGDPMFEVQNGEPTPTGGLTPGDLAWGTGSP